MKHTHAVRTMLKALAAMAPRRLWLGGMAMACLTVLMGMALLGLSGWFIAATAMAGLVPLTALVFDVFMPSAGIRLLALGRTGSRYAERLLTHDATLAVLAALRERLFRSWAPAGSAWQLRMRPARWLQRLTSDVDALDSLYLRLLVPLAAACGAALLAAVVLAGMRWWLGLLLGLWLLLAGVGLAVWLARKARRPATRRAVALEALRAQAVDLVAGQTDLLMAGRLSAQCERMAATEQRVAQADRQLNRLEARASMGYGAAGALTLAGVLLAVAALAEQGRIGAPGAALALLVALAAMEPFAALRRGAAEAGRTLLAIKRLAPQVQSADAASSLIAQRPAAGVALSLQSATTRPYGSQRVVLGPLSLVVRQGEHVAVVGRSGAGKSTLLLLLAGELLALQGSVAAEPVTWLTQRTELFQDSLRDNLLLAQPEASDAALWQALQDAGLAADVRAMPQGLDTLLGEGGLGLSGGQARRLALARLLLHPAGCWLLDEPTEGLDAATAADVLQRLRQQMQTQAQVRTVVVATHLRREAELADRVLWLEQGRPVLDAPRGSAEFARVLAQLREDADGVAQQGMTPDF
ncbi:amino acid ABC transporter ATP-binding/permease protein [Comamonas sp. GB3 AK4-5]|uniref:amino acid ABC transporter ATP-binding/permease protein n=1 Tax=Comamonas sp. GB3 AK4-5 TaxID=3231487 RepID=UPI00351E4674